MKLFRSQVITAALGIADPAEIRSVNTVRGAWIPDDDAERLRMVADFGFTLHQPGPDHAFYEYFKHYVMNPFRPSAEAFLTEDHDGDVVLAPLGGVVGGRGEHGGIIQDNRLEIKQARFLLELLNWLRDVHVARTERVWAYGWDSKAEFYQPGKSAREPPVSMLDRLSEYFVDQQVGGRTAAAFASLGEAREALYAWEAAHPGESSFTYPSEERDWCLYPYLGPAFSSLTEASYQSAMPAAGMVSL